MKFFLFITFILAGFVSFSQQSPGNDTARYTWNKFQYGSRMPRFQADSVLVSPRDTMYSKSGIAVIGRTLYVGDGISWTAAGGPTGSTDPGSEVADSVTQDGSVYCWHKGGNVTCWDLGNFIDSLPLNHNETYILHYNKGVKLPDSTKIPHTNFFGSQRIKVINNVPNPKDVTISFDGVDTTYVTPDSLNLVVKYTNGTERWYQFVAGGSGGGGSGSGAPSWLLTGNPATSSSTNFIGTTDNTDLIFRRFGTRAGLISRGNTSFGDSALVQATGQNNVAFGPKALTFTTTGINNTAFGAFSLTNNTASSNSAFGYAALFNNTSGISNTAFGSTALFLNTTGANNSAFGGGSLANNTTGNYNTGFGSNALYRNTTGVSNMGIGYYTLLNNVTGNDNTGAGVSALRGNKTGNFNTAIGREALWTDSFANNNTAVGWRAGYANSGSNNVLIGSQAGYSETASNKLYISNSATATPLIYGDFAAGGLVFSPVSNSQMSTMPSPRSGMVVYNTDMLVYYYFDGTIWKPLSGGGGGATPNLQAVTDVGNTTTNYIQASQYVINGPALRYNLNPTGQLLANGYGAVIQFDKATGNLILQPSATSGVAGAVPTYKSPNLQLKPSGVIALLNYGGGSRTGTPAYSLQVDATGNVIEGAVGALRVMTKLERNAIKKPEKGLTVLVKNPGKRGYLSFWDGSVWLKMATQTD